MSEEFNGHYENCLDCGYTWDYSDDACPQCGMHNITELNAGQVMCHYAFVGEPEFSRVVDMLKKHGD